MLIQPGRIVSVLPLRLRELSRDNIKRAIDTNKTNDMDEEDKIINDEPLLSESYTNNEFSVESRMLHHCKVEGQNGLKKANNVAGVCVAGRWENCGRWSWSSWSVWLVVAGDIASEGRNVVKGNRVQLQLEGLATKTGMWLKETRFRYGLVYWQYRQERKCLGALS